MILIIKLPARVIARGVFILVLYNFLIEGEEYMGLKWFKDEKGYGFVEYKANGEITIYYYEFQNKKERITTIKKEV